MDGGFSRLRRLVGVGLVSANSQGTELDSGLQALSIR